MSNEPSIEQMNRMIAEFMGYEQYEDEYGIWFKREGLIKCLHPKLQSLAYHTKWDDLMPVWESFRDLTFSEVKDQMTHSDLKFFISQSICYWGINNAHKRLYDAIQWLNQQKQTND